MCDKCRAYPIRLSVRALTSLCWRHLTVVLWRSEYHGSLAGANSPVGLWDVYKAVCWTWTSCCATLLPPCAHHSEAVRAIHTVYLINVHWWLYRSSPQYVGFHPYTVADVMPYKKYMLGIRDHQCFGTPWPPGKWQNLISHLYDDKGSNDLAQNMWSGQNRNRLKQGRHVASFLKQVLTFCLTFAPANRFEHIYTIYFFKVNYPSMPPISLQK